MIRSRRAPRKSNRRLLVESLESRQLLAVDGIRIDLSGNGNIDLFNPNGSGVQEGYGGGLFGGSIGTSNVPGQNNEKPVAGEDAATANEDGPAITIQVADLLSNDSDPDNSGPLAIIAVSNVGTRGVATLDSSAGTITYDPNGAFESLAVGETATDTFRYSLDDSKGGRGIGTVVVTITGSNDAPTISGVAAATANEGSLATHAGTFADADSSDNVTLTTADGTVVDNGDGTWSWSLTTSDDVAEQEIKITATDGQSASSEFTFQLTVNNVTPTVALSGSGTAMEGTPYALTLGAISDPGSDTITGYSIDWGDGTLLEPTATAGIKSHTYVDGPSDYTITVSATDEDGTHIVGTHSLTVGNVAPDVTVNIPTVTVNEGGTASNAGTFADLGDDSVALSASMGTIIKNDDGTWAWSAMTTDGPTESQIVTITATDSDEGSTTTTFELVVNNLNPIVAADIATVTVDEGETASNAGTYSDVAADSVTLMASVGTITDNNDGTWAWSYNSMDGPDDSQTVTVTATDQDGGQSTVDFELVVNNLAPVAAAQSLEVLGNVPITLPLSSLLTGATDAGNDVLTFDSIDNSGMDGTLTVDSIAGTFRYEPLVGSTADDTFTFTIADSDGLTHQETATLSITRSLWVVDYSLQTSGDGSIGSPFNSFTPLNHVEGSPDVDQPGDILFIAGSGTQHNVSHAAHNDGGFHLEDDQFLVGSGLPVTLDSYLSTHGVAVPTGSDSLPSTSQPGPTLTNTTGDVVTVSNNNTIAGFAADPTASAGIAGENVSGLTVEFVIIITSGGDGDNEGVRLTTVSGTMTFNSVDIGSESGETNSGPAIQIDGGTATIEFNDVDIDQDGGSLLQILNTAASTITFDENSELNLQGSDQAAVTITGNNGGTVTLNNDGLSAGTTAEVKFNITDNTGLVASTPVNDAPDFALSLATIQTLEDGGPQSLSIASGITPGADESEASQMVSFNVLTNDNEAMFATLPQIDASGNLTYTLAESALGTANLTVNLQDDGGTEDGGIDTSETKSFSIEVVPVNDAPSFLLAGDPSSVLEDAGPQSISGFASSLSAGPVDESDQALTFEISGNTNEDLFAVAPAISSTGELSYTPADDMTGSATITVVLKDDGGIENGGVDISAARTFTITVSPPVNDAPSFTLAGDPDAVSEDAGDQSIPAIATAISAGPIDESGQTLGFVVTNDNDAMFSVQPTISVDGTLSYTAAPNMHGSAVLTIALQDNGGTENGGIDTSVTQSLTITVAPINDAPVLGTIADLTIDELTTMSFTATAMDVDVPSDTLTFTLDGTEPTGAVISTDGEFSWTPTEADGAGTFMFDIIVSDGNLEDRQSIAITVNEVNTAPAIGLVSDHAINEGTELTFSVSATDADLPANTLAFSLDSNSPDGAVITESGDFSWTPSESQGPGEFTFAILVSDGITTATSETITVTVADVNNAPILAVVGDQSISEGQALTFTASATDSDLPANTLTFSLGDAAPDGAAITAAGVFTWTPGEDQDGTHPIIINVTDGELIASETIAVSVAEVNDAPVLAAIGNRSVNELETLSFTATADDADLPENELAFSLGQSAPVGASISTEGEFAWTPSESDGAGTFTFDVIVSDGTDVDSETITVTVAEVNAAPVFAAISNASVNEGQALTFTVSATDSDLPVNSLTYSLDGNAPNGATVNAQGEFSWTPSEADGGKSFEFSVIVSDGTTTTTSPSIMVTVNEQNVAPVISAIGDQSVNEGELLTFAVTATDSDLPTDTLVYSLRDDAPEGVSIDGNGIVSWTPTEEQGAGQFNFTIQVSDGQLFDDTSVVVNVSEVNAAPMLASINSQTVISGSTIAFTASATDADLPANTLTYSLSGNVPAGATFSSDGMFTWTPTDSQAGIHEFEVVVTDGGSSPQEDRTSVSIEVADVRLSKDSQAFFEFTTVVEPINASVNVHASGLLLLVQHESLQQNSQAFMKLPGDSHYQELDFSLILLDHDNDPETPDLDTAKITGLVIPDFDPNATDFGLSAYHEKIRGQWEIFVDLDGDFSTTGSVEPREDAVFTFDVDPSLIVEPALVTLTSPISSPIISDTVDLSWDIAGTAPPNSLVYASVEKVDSSDDDPYFSHLTDATDGSATASGLPFGEQLDATVLSLVIDQEYVSGLSLADGRDGLRFDSVDSFANYGIEYDIESPFRSSSATGDDFGFTLIAPNNARPVIEAINDIRVEGPIAFQYQVNASDAENDPITFALLESPADAQISDSGLISWTTPDLDSPQVFEFSVQVHDGQTSNSEDFQLTVVPANRAPVISPIGNVTADAGSLYTFVIGVEDSQTSRNDLIYSFDGDAPENATVSSSGIFQWNVPEIPEQLNYQFDLVVSDGELEARTPVNLNVNMAPAITMAGPITIPELSELVLTLEALDANGDEISFRPVSKPFGSELYTTGEFRWTPSTTQSGDHTLIVKASDGRIESEATIQIHVTNTNVAPEFRLFYTGDGIIEVGQTLTLPFWETTADSPDDGISFSLGGNVPNGAAISSYDPVTRRGEITWTPSSDQIGEHTIELVATDGSSAELSATETISISVSEPIVLPTLADVTFEVGIADLDGQIVYLSYFDLEVIGPNHTETTQIAFKRVGDTEFIQPEADGDHQSAGFNYSSFTEFWDAHNGIHDFAIDVDGDGNYDETFTVDVNLDGFTSDSFPSYPVITSPSGDIDDTRPTITWDTISGAESVVVSAHAVNGVGIENLDELWWTHPSLPGTATSVTTGELPTGQPLLAGVQANFRHDELATAASDDGLVSLSFFTQSIGTSAFSISDRFLIDDEFNDGHGGVPEGWAALEAGGPIVESGSNLTITAGSTDDDWTVVAYPDTLIDLQGGPATFTTAIDSLSVGANAFFGFIDLESDAGVGIDFFSDGRLQLSSPDDGTYHTGLQLAGYDPSQAVEISLTIESSGVRIQAMQGDSELDSGLLSNASLSGFNAASLVDPVSAVFAVGNVNAQVVIDAITVSGIEAPEAAAEYESDLVLGLAEARSGDDATTQLAFMELSFEGADVPFNGNSRAYVQLPGTSNYIEADGWINSYDHDGDWNTPMIQNGEYSLDVEQGSQSLADFHASIRGTWTVYIDLDGDFDSSFPAEESSDAKFTFVWDNSDLSNLPPAPTITSPVDGATVDGSDGVTLTWDVEAGSMTGIEVDTQVFSDADNIYHNHNDLTVSGQTATTPSLPGGKTFEAEVIHVDEYRSFASDAQNASGFVSLELGATESIIGSFHQIEFTTRDEPFAEFELAIEQANLPDGSVETFAFLDIGLNDSSTWTQEMEIHVKRPGKSFEQQPTGWSYFGFEMEMAADQSVDDFIVSLAGEYVVGVDYDGATDGNSDFDEQFTVTLDLSGINESSFLDAPTIVTPATNQNFAAGNRSVAFEWNDVDGADFYIVGVDGANDADTDPGVTNYTFDFLPTDTDLFGFVGAAEERDATTLGDGDPTVDHQFFIATYQGVEFSIEPELTAVLMSNSSGSHAGGSSTIGGLDFDFVGVNRDAFLLADYVLLDGWDDAADLFGGSDRVQSFLATAQWTGEIYQAWDVELFDAADEDVSFVYTDLTLHYDTSLFAQDWSTLSSDDIEAGTYAFQFDETSGSWETLQLLARDMDDDTITVRADSSGPIMLGYHWNGPGVEPDDGQSLAEIDFEIYHANVDGETFFGSNVDILTQDPRVEQATTIKWKGPLDADYQIISGGWGWESTDYEPTGEQTLTEFLNSLDGDYELHYDFAGDGTFEESMMFQLDTAGLSLSDFAAAPTVTSPVDGTTFSADNRTPTISWNAVPEADYIVVDFQAIEPDGILVEPTIFETEVPATTTSVTSELLPTGVDFFTPIGAVKELDDAPVQIGGTDEIDVRFSLGRFSPVNFSIARADNSVPAGDSSGTFDGVDYSLEGVASPAKFRAEYQPIGPNQEIMAMVYGSEQAVQDSFNVFYPAGEYHEGWRINLTDDNGNDVAATGVQITLQYDPSLMVSEVNESQVRPFQYDQESGTWSEATMVNHDTTANTMTIHTEQISAIVLGMPSLDNLQAASAADIGISHSSLTTDQLLPIVEEAIDRLADAGISEDAIEKLQSTRIEITDLEGNQLGATNGEQIWVDINAAGHGWFVDPTPEFDEEFSNDDTSIAPSGIDLLTTVMHELGHVLGLEHSESPADLMYEALGPGERLLAGVDEDLLELLADR